jgi:DNA-binding NtrC family response regulator
MIRVLVVDDKELMRDSVATTLSRAGHTVVTASGGKNALTKLAERPCDVVITDLQMPEIGGIELLEEIRKRDEQIAVIFMTAYGTVETAVQAMKLGAFDYITKPFSGDELIVAVERAVTHSKLIKENQILKAAQSPAGTKAGESRHAMIGDGQTMATLRERLKRIADSHGTVMISGESGSGKEVAARWIHGNSPRANQAFLAINCAALSTNLLESELFGHEKGAFTGADRLRKGRFELADGGTLLLDEISEIAPEIQAKLLRVLQEQTFERVGSSEARNVDVRVIATTNRDLPSEVAAGRFRADLYFRLNVLPVTMPPLRDRAEDITQLALHFLKQVATREGKPVKALEADALQLLHSYSWRGNVRELQNIIERAAVLTDDETIRAAMIGPWLTDAVQSAPSFHAMERSKAAAMIEASPNGNGYLHHDLPAVVCDGKITLEDLEREAIVATLKHHQGHRQRSAEALGIGVRTLGLKLKKWKEQNLVAETL